MKKICKIILVFLIVTCLYSITYNGYATDFDIWGSAGNFLNAGAGESSGEFNSTKVNNTMIGIIDFLYGIGLLIAFVATIILGIKYMMVNPNEKSRIKQATTPYIIGVVIIFGAATIWRLIIVMLEGSMLGR